MAGAAVAGVDAVNAALTVVAVETSMILCKGFLIVFDSFFYHASPGSDSFYRSKCAFFHEARLASLKRGGEAEK